VVVIGKIEPLLRVARRKAVFNISDRTVSWGAMRLRDYKGKYVMRCHNITDCP